MSDRLFLLDKNYILKQVQSDLRLKLQNKLIDLIKEGYYAVFNPLRLSDSTTDLIDNYVAANQSYFDELYDVVAGIYRFQIGDNQLEFLFDGSSHYDKYVIDWEEAFINYMNELCTKKNFVLAGLELTVFHKPENRIELAQNRMKVSIFDHFGLKIYKYKGIQALKDKTA
ncbi:hypothetical protein [Roseivirga misakiensis]|uniref:Uncharacterized protein n=1 Tax=Roseivirga misakiensis TaxID=1563681 RepID=A0A1E5T3G3_9BACT|nr:hypothetical protein [Roseivirga misakiensis]OEK05896.1 hypothetical protein BFP71_07210 [Roseivirga misakiensis]